MAIHERRIGVKPELRFKEIKFEGDEATYIIPTPEQMQRLCFSLAREIREREIKERGITFDRVVTIGKGGLTWVRAVADVLEVESVVAFGMTHYQDIDKPRPKAIMTYSLPVSVEKQSILLFDELDQTGDTLIKARTYLEICGVRELVTATLFHKPYSKFVPDYSVVTTTNWVVFTLGETWETMMKLSAEWGELGHRPETLKERFLIMGLPPEQVEYFTEDILR